jgi:hypothetical protein
MSHWQSGIAKKSFGFSSQKPMADAFPFGWFDKPVDNEQAPTGTPERGRGKENHGY